MEEKSTHLLSENQRYTDVPPPYSSPGPQAYPHPPQPVPPPINPPQIHNVVPAQIVVAPAVGPESCTLTCRSCHALVRTRVERNSTTKTHLMALLLCLFGCWPCVCLPYCMDSCMNADHYCPNCNAFLGSYAN